eukprot:XP_780226.4 PREDICTED: uncharacterized protein LOC574749 [Strongylocentrotus purpuratus]
MIPILATACLLATVIKFSLPQLPGAEWNSLNTRLADRLRLLHNDLAADTLTPAEAGSNFESILQDFFAEIPDFANNQNEQRSFARREPKLLDEARKIKNRLRRRAFRQSSSKEDRDMFHAALATYTHLKKRRDEQTCERNAQHEERCFKRNFWDYSKKIVKDSLYSRSATPTCSADTANDYFKSRYESPSSVDPSSLSWIPPLKNPISDFNTDPIRPKDVKNVLQRKSSHSSPGPDGIYYEHNQGPKTAPERYLTVIKCLEYLSSRGLSPLNPASISYLPVKKYLDVTMPVSVGEWRVLIGTFIRWRRKDMITDFSRNFSLDKRAKNVQSPEAFNSECNTSQTRSQCDGPDCDAVKESGSSCDVKSPGPNEVSHSESSCAENGGSPTANETNPVRDSSGIQNPDPRPWSEDTEDDKDIAINLMSPESPTKSSQISKTDQPEVGTSESYSNVHAAVPGETDRIKLDKEETSNSAPSGKEDQSSDLSPESRQDTTRNTEQTTPSIKKVTEYHGSPTYPVLGSGITSCEADAIKGNDCPDMTNILLLRSGDVERNPGPDNNPGSLTEFELYLLAEGMDPSDFRKVGLALGFTEAQLSRFERDKLGNSMQASYQMLYEWRKTVRESKERGILVNKLESIKMVKLADSVRKVFDPFFFYRPDLSRGGDYSAFKETSKHDVGSKVIRGDSPFRILLISSEVPAYQLLVSAAKPDVLPIVYEYNGSTIESLLEMLQATVGSHQARSIGLFTLGEDSVRIIREMAITAKMIEHPDIKNFWESFSQCIESAKEGGSMDFFAPLEATAGGHEMMSRLSSLLGLRLSSPATLSPTRFDYVTGEWLDTAHTRPNPSPHSLYFQAGPLQAWQALAGRVAEATTRCSEDLRGFFVQRREQLLHRVTGDVVLQELGEDGLSVCDQIMEALREALEELARHPDQPNPAAFLGETLLKVSGQPVPPQGMTNGVSDGATRQSKKMSGLKLASESQDDLSIGEDIEEEIEEEYDEGSEQELIKPTKSRSEPIQSKTFLRTHSKPSTMKQTFQSMQLTTPPGKTQSERRRALANEILDSERVYLRRLNIIHNVYFERLAAALRSNHAIIGQTNISLIFTDTNNILNVTRGLFEELKGRVESWSVQMCLGDCFIKFQSKLKAYTNFHNNYAIVLSTIDKCREQEPSFRAFLKQHDSSASSEMMTLDELLLGVAHHIHHYTRLLLAIHHATPDDHPDKEDLMTAIDTFRQLQDLIDQNKQRGERERVLKGLQKRIVGCPSLLEANRFLVQQLETVALMESVTQGKTSESKGPMKHVNDLCLFLFNDALVVTHEGSRHVPYTRRSETFYRFMVALSLTRLQVQDVPDSKYVQHAILLVSPKKRLLCSAEDYSSKVALLSILEETIRAALDVD